MADGIDTLSTLLMVVIETDQQDLLLNVVSAITNLSFYGRIDAAAPPSCNNENGEEDDDDSGGGYRCRSKIFSRREEICSCLVGVLLHDNQLAVVEAARAFGNFSRDEVVRGVIVAARADEAMSLLLTKECSDETTFAVVGCLVNLAASQKHNRILTGGDGCEGYECASKLIRMLRKFGLKRVSLSAVTCKVLYNLSYSCGGASKKFAGCFRTADSEDGLDNVLLLRDTLMELVDVAEDARADETAEETKEGGYGGGYGGSKYDEFIDTGNALLKVVADTVAIIDPRDDDNNDWRGEGKIDDEDDEDDDDDVDYVGQFKK